MWLPRRKFALHDSAAKEPLPRCAHSRAQDLARSHRTGDQLIAFFQFTFQDLGDLGNRVVRNTGTNPYWFEGVVRMQLPKYRDIKTGCTCQAGVTSATLLARRASSILL